ncbi:MAG: extracellular solute-binding protein [Candidatus Omnitrophota bacterium]
MGCSRPPPDTLTVAMSLSESEWKVFREEVFYRFEQISGVRVNGYQVESGQLATKLEALQAAGRSEIDVFAQDNMNLAALVNKGLVEDLSPYESDIPKSILPNLTSSCKFNGKLMFMPFRPNVQIVYYNKAAFKRYGIEPPQSWNELLEAAKKFKQEEGVGRVLLKAYGGNPTATQVYEFILQAGGDPYAFDDEGCVTAFRFLRTLGPYISPESKRAKWDTTNEILARKEAYIAQNWPFGVVILVKEYGLSDIGTYSGFHGPAGEQHVIGGDVFGIPVTSKHKHLARIFIQFIQTKGIQELLVSKLGWPSARSDAYGEVEPWLRPHFDAVNEALRHGRFREQITWWPAYEKYVNEAFREIVLEGADVEKTLSRYKGMLEKEKARFE